MGHQNSGLAGVDDDLSQSMNRSMARFTVGLVGLNKTQGRMSPTKDESSVPRKVSWVVADERSPLSGWPGWIKELNCEAPGIDWRRPVL